MENKVYILTAIRDSDDCPCGVEVIGVFDSENKANKAKKKVIKWMKEHDYVNYGVFIMPTEINRMTWYDLEENI